MTIGRIYGTALKVQNLTNEEWDAFNRFFDERDQIGNTFRTSNPVLYSALLRLKENQAKIETLDALNMFCSGKFDTDTYDTPREMAIYACNAE
jgi:hypothetical protein